jgi:hypothetical protein
MPLQNRVTPFGDIVATPERGTMLGNRGVLHDDRRTLVRASQVRRWICCHLSFKEQRRTPMTPRSWTELFFLDEATAFAAGHRPCFYCRRAAALAFQACWARAIGGATDADAMDRTLDADRRQPDKRKRTYTADARGLPDGVFVAHDRAAWLLRAGRMLRWTHAGYAEARAIAAGQLDVLTPRSMTAVIAAGYSPGVHPSADAVS